MDEGASPNTLDEDGFSPLTEAAYCGRADMVASLLSYGANLSFASDGGFTPLS